MNRSTYYVNDLQFELAVEDGYETFHANVKVDKCTYLYGDDADGNRGVYVTDREADVQEVWNEEGKPVVITDAMTEEIQTIIDEKGSNLE